ncbi:MAG: hypothetical protein ACTSRZ_13635 [Promethearchaeota archaeon]
MVVYKFKLLGSIDERGFKEIDIGNDANITVGEVKEIVKKAFHMAPSLKVSLIIEGKTLNEDHHIWSKVAIINPKKDIVRVLGTRV